MKKTILFASLLLAGSSFSQGFTPANEPAIGDATNMFLCDSFATNYANVVGAGVTWDYSAIKKIYGEMRSISTLNAATSPNAADFPGANKNFEIQNFISTYWETTPLERNSKGFVYSGDPSLGVVKVVLNTNPAKLMNYEFDLNDEINDTYAGTLSFLFNGFPMSPAATGTSYTKVDGKGTLILNAATTLTDVLRVITIDTLNAVVPIAGSATFIRAQYEYYHFATSKLPVFSHSTGIMTAGTNVLGEFTIVLSAFEPDHLLAVNNAKVDNFNVYPNPVKSDLTIQGDFTQADAQILNQAGQVVKTISAVTPGTIIKMTELENGLYFLNLNINGQNNVQKIIKD